MMQLSQVCQAVNGRLIGNDMMLHGVTTDSRADCHQQLFIALDGDQFDGHDYVSQAQSAGAVAALIDKEINTELSKVKVTDTHQALKDLATWWRAQFVIPLIAVTGSVGKTSVKEMLGCIFSEIGEGLVTKGNLNNEIGLPLTLLRLSENDKYAIVEMGMNHSGEISRLTNIAKPTIALVNNAAAAHLEGLGSVEAVAHAKGEIFEGLSQDGVGIINVDDKYADLWKGLVGKRRTLTFGLTSDAEVTAQYKLGRKGLKMEVTAPDQTSFTVNLQTVGKHNVSNALAAIAVSLASNVPVSCIQKGLEKYRPIDGRLNISHIGSVTLIDDSYNANPASVKAAIEVLSQFDKTILILGDMAELGQAAELEHKKIGKVAADNSISRLYACGEFAEQVVEGFAGNGFAFASQDELISELVISDLADSAILVKGSRSAKMERTIEALISTLKPNASNDEGGLSC